MAEREAPSLRDWNEWRRVCALDRCVHRTRVGLQAFAHNRFRSLIRRYAHRTGTEEPGALASGIGPREAWHLLESRFVVQSTRRGKRYKDWLFARLERSADPPLDVIQGGATLILRDAVREYLRKEFAPPRTRSLHGPLHSSTGDPITLEELLPGEHDVAEEAARREYQRLAAEHARSFFAGADARERVVILARGLGISFASPTVEGAAGRRKSVLSQAYRRFVERMAAELRRLYPEEDGASLVMLGRMTLEAVTDRVVEWAKSENRFEPFFLFIEEGNDAGQETAPA